MNEANKIAILPLGATEQHGPHLPLETDSIIAEAVCARAVLLVEGAMTVEILPVETIGYSIEHSDFPGTRTFQYNEAIALWVAIGAEQKSRGISKLVMLNAHGGNSPLMTIVATELRVRHSMLAVATSWTRFGYPSDLVDDEEKTVGIHGGFVETSVMLALRPDLVKMEKAENFPSRQSVWAEANHHLRAYGPHAFGWKMRDLNAKGAAGNAAAATAEVGERLLDHAASGLAELLIDVEGFDMAQFD